MHERIGELAGRIWWKLGETGKTPILDLLDPDRETAGMVFLALGWLARENKVVFEESTDYGLAAELTPKEIEVFEKTRGSAVSAA